MARRALAWVAAGTTMVLVALGTGLAAPAGAADSADGGFCTGMSAPQNVHGGNQAPALVNDSAGALAGGTRTIRVLGNDSDPDGDDLFVVSVSTPERGDACIDGDGVIEYFAVSSATNYTDHLTYGVTDGDLYRTATVTVNVQGIKPLRAQLVLRKHGKHKARIRFTNGNNRSMLVLAGSPKAKKADFTRTITPGATVGFKTKHKRIIFFALVPDLDGAPILVDVGALNTRTGRQSLSSGDGALLRKNPSLRPLQRQWLGRQRLTQRR